MTENAITNGIESAVNVVCFVAVLMLFIGIFASAKPIKVSVQKEQENNVVSNVSSHVASYADTYNASDVYYEILDNASDVTIILNKKNLTKKEYDDTWSYLEYVRTIDNSVLWKEVKKHDYYIKKVAKNNKGQITKITYSESR